MQRIAWISAAAATLALLGCAPFGRPPHPDDYSDSFYPRAPSGATLPGGNWPTTGTLASSLPPPVAPGPLRLNVNDTVLLALENNTAFQIDRLQPAIRRTFEGDARAAFDPILIAGITGTRNRVESNPPGGPDGHSITERVLANAGLSEFLPTGTTLNMNATSSRSDSTGSPNQDSTRAGFTVTQALLQGAGLGPNLAGLRQARLDTLSSEYEVRGFAEQTVATVEETYWDYVLAAQQIDIVQQALDLAEQQLRDSEERVRLGKLPESELYASRAEVALRRENLINAKSILATTRLSLLRLVNPPGPGLWQRDLISIEKPFTPEINLGSVEDHVDIAMRWRPDLNQARLQIQKDDLELVKTRNGLLPVLDVFITLGRTGYADSFQSSVNDMKNDSYDTAVGGTISYPLFNRAARARDHRAHLNRRQAEESLNNLEQLAQVDVRSAFIEIDRAREQVAATAATRQFQEESLRVEMEKFNVGKSTSLLVNQAQRDLLTSQIEGVRAVVAHLRAVIELYRLEGSLLERRGIEAPGRQPVAYSPGSSDPVADSLETP